MPDAGNVLLYSGGCGGLECKAAVIPFGAATETWHGGIELSLCF